MFRISDTSALQRLFLDLNRWLCKCEALVGAIHLCPLIRPPHFEALGLLIFL